MKCAAYDKYQASGISWVGAMPSHWSAAKTKNLFDLMKRPPRDDDGVVTAFRDGQVTLRSNRRTDGFTNSLQEIGYQGVRKGDLVIHAMDAFAGAVGVSDSDGKSTPVYSVCKPRGGIASAPYYGRLLRYMALSGYIDSLAKGIRERSTEFRWADAGNVYLPVPPIDEQTAIATFLDRETAKIDALIAEQEKLIALLAEKRQATISHAVTRGLNPHAPMKDSGVPWLGEVPAHWALHRLKQLLAQPLTYGANEAADDQTPENPRFIRITDIDERGQLRDETFRSLPMQIAHPFLLETGDLLLARSGATVGKSFRYREGWGPCCFAGYLIRARPNQRLLLPDYLHGYCQSVPYWQYIKSEQIQATIQNVSAERYGDLVLPLPTISEQHTISKFIEHRASELEGLAGEAESMINLLQERRSALIAAAVTGQIDVRGIYAEEAP